MTHSLLEICCFDLGSCQNAQLGGADRVELCADPGDGGTTPSFGLIKESRKLFLGELYPIIRPRGGDFLYSEEEFQVMKKDIKNCRALGCDGVVVGMLNADGTVDKTRVSRLVEWAYPMGVTFHRAFDRALNPWEALEVIVQTGCERILTSGQRPTILEGAGLVAELIKISGNRIIIMPGSGVRTNNILEIAASTGAFEFHSSARKNSSSRMEFFNHAMREQLDHPEADLQEIRAMKSALAGLAATQD